MTSSFCWILRLAMLPNGKRKHRCHANCCSEAGNETNRAPKPLNTRNDWFASGFGSSQVKSKSGLSQVKKSTPYTRWRPYRVECACSAGLLFGASQHVILHDDLVRVKTETDCSHQQMLTNVTTVRRHVRRKIFHFLEEKTLLPRWQLKKKRQISRLCRHWRRQRCDRSWRGERRIKHC